jgi:hypothetical protein
MDEIPQVTTNREALKRILATLVGMVEMGAGRAGAGGLGAGGRFTFFPQKGATAQNEVPAEKSKMSPALNTAPSPAPNPAPTPAFTLPRHLYRAILLLLRPAESAVRRLIIAAARGIVVTLPPFRPRKAKPKISDTVAAMRRLGLAVSLSREDFARYQAEQKAAERRAARPRTLSLSLLDPMKYPLRIRRRYTPAPSPTDPIGAAKLMLRLQALGRALDDLPGQAQRFARWRARNEAVHARVKEGLEPWRPRRIWPLRGGRPPGRPAEVLRSGRPAPQEHPRDRRDSGALPFYGALCAGPHARRHVMTAPLRRYKAADRWPARIFRGPARTKLVQPWGTMRISRPVAPAVPVKGSSHCPAGYSFRRGPCPLAASARLCRPGIPAKPGPANGKQGERDATRFGPTNPPAERISMAAQRRAIL